MSINLYNLLDRHIRDFVHLDSDTLDVIYLDTAGSLQYNENTAEKEAHASGDKYSASSVSFFYAKESGDGTVNAKIRTMEIIRPNIFERFTTQSIFLRVAPGSKSYTITKYSENMNVPVPGNVDRFGYNDPLEINNGAAIPRLNGTRNSYPMSDIPIGSDNSTSISIKIEVEDEAEIHSLSLVTSNEAPGGDR